MYSTPILFLVFNRFDTTQVVFESIKSIRPTQLFVAADGPRDSRADEALVCQKIRNYILDNIDWECEVKTLFRQENMGCHPAVSEAISWFFDHVEKGVILEDDTVPHPSFYKYCTELLDYHEENKEIAMISGDNFQKSEVTQTASYYFGAYAHIWGWATWKDRWNRFEGNLNEVNRSVLQANLPFYFSEPSIQQHWMQAYDKMKKQDTHAWDISWNFKIWAEKKIILLPNKNLVTNIGFGVNATHTHNEEHKYANLSTEEMLFPIQHASEIKLNKKAILYSSEFVFGVLVPRTFFQRVIRKLLGKY